MEAYSSVFTEEYIAQIITVFCIIYYLFQCYFGYRFIKFLIALAGFIVGFTSGFVFSVNYLPFQKGYIPALIGIAVGALLALLAFKLYYLGVFVMCGGIAASAVMRLPLTGILRTVLCILAFLVAGIIAVKFAKFCIICITSISGAINAVNFLKNPFPVLDENIIIMIAVTGILAVSGILVQRVTSVKSRHG